MKLLCMLLAIAPLCMCDTGRARAERMQRIAWGLVGACVPAYECMEARDGGQRRLVAEYGDGSKLMGEGGEDEAVDDVCTELSSLRACLDECDGPPADGSLAALGVTLYDFACQDRKQDVKEAIGCFKGVFTQGDPMQTVQNDEQCSACQPMVANVTQWHERMSGHWMHWEVGSLRQAVGTINDDDGPSGKACALVRCSLGCLEHIAEDKCGDAKHGTVLRDFVTVVNEFRNRMYEELGLDCLVPNACKHMHEAA